MRHNAWATQRAGPAPPGGGRALAGGRARRRGGFTLSEILIATAILGVGLVMIIAVFPVAIEQNKDSTSDTLGTIICENGLAAAKAAWTDPLGVSTTFNPALIDTVLVLDGNYPTAQPAGSAYRGFFVLARQVKTGRDDYQLLVVSYLKSRSNDSVRPISVNTDAVGLPSGATQFYAMVAYGGTSPLKIGSPVIDPGSGRYATIVSLAQYGGSQTIVNLDRALGATIGANRPVIVVAETDSSYTPIATIPLSPVTKLMFARASLRQ